MADKLTSLASEIVAAYVASNKLAQGDLPGLLKSVYGALGGAAAPVAAEPASLAPAVPIRRSVTPSAIICLACGKKFKSMRRHVQSHGDTPDSYRKKWGLPSDYPMVSADYAAARSELAKAAGLGLGGRGGAPRAQAGATPMASAVEAGPTSPSAKAAGSSAPRTGPGTAATKAPKPAKAPRKRAPSKVSKAPPPGA